MHLHRYVLAILTLILTLFTSCKYGEGRDSEGDKRKSKNMMSAEVIFTDTLHDFGTVVSSDPIKKHVFVFTNTGEVPAVILNATPSCHCLSVDYTKEAVLPGKKGEVTVIFNGTDQTFGWFDKSVRLRFNSERQHTLRVKGELRNGSI